MCQDCFNNCNGVVISDKCVRYAGDDVPLLGISKGQPLSEIEEIIFDKLLDFAVGAGITLSQITLGCSHLSNLLGSSDKTLANLVQVLVDGQCSLRQMVQTLQTQANTPYSFDTSCLDLSSYSSPTKDDILQATIKKLCSVAADVALIKADYVKATQLNTLIQQYISGTASSTVQQSTKMVPFVAYEYYGSLSNFDNTGKGLSSAGFDKVYLCNGLNGTPDKRGRTAVGAVAGVPGGVLDSEVDPVLPQNAGTNYTLKQKFGKHFVLLTPLQLPAHSHPITDPGHIHLTKSGWVFHSDGDGAGSGISNSGHDAVDYDTKTNDGLNPAYTGITVGNAGGNQAHENRQPSIAAYFIMHLP